MLLEIDPNNADALSRKGYSLYKQDNFEEANELLDEVLEKEPNDVFILKQG